MAEFYEAVTTEAGLALAADLLTGEQIVFTKLVTGSGSYDVQDMTRPSLQRAWQIKEPRQIFDFSRIEKVTDNCILLKSLISNINLTEGYRMTEIGVYAKKKSDEEGEILYSISVAKEPDFFPRYNGLAAVEIIEEYYITVSDAAEVVLQAGSGAAVLAEDLEKLKKELEELLKQKIEELQRKIDEAEDPFVQMMEDTYIPPEKRSKGTLYGLITNQRGLVINSYDRYIYGEEDPLVERTLYGIETQERTSAQEDTNPYAGILNNIVHIEDGQEVERRPFMIYAVNKQTRR